jgi:hypothetical protein
VGKKIIPLSFLPAYASAGRVSSISNGNILMRKT